MVSNQMNIIGLEFDLLTSACCVQSLFLNLNEVGSQSIEAWPDGLERSRFEPRSLPDTFYQHRLPSTVSARSSVLSIFSLHRIGHRSNQMSRTNRFVCEKVGDELATFSFFCTGQHSGKVLPSLSWGRRFKTRKKELDLITVGIIITDPF